MRPWSFGICPAVEDRRADWRSDAACLSLVGERSLTPQRGFERFSSTTATDHGPLTVRPSASPRGYPRPVLRAGSLTTRPAVGTASWRCLRARVALRRSQLPWFASVGRCVPPGGGGRAGRAGASAAGAFAWALWAPARPPLTLGHFDDGSPHLRLCCPSMLARRDTLRTSHRSGGYAITLAPRGRGLHPHGNCVTKPPALRSSRGHQSSFDQRIARNFKRYFAPAWLRAPPRAAG